MKKAAIILLAIAMMISVTSCGQKEQTIKIIIPAGSTEQFVYSEEEISPNHNKLKISAGDGLRDTEVILKRIDGREENAYEPTYLTPGVPTEMNVEKGAWFQIGVSAQNFSDADKQVYVLVQDVDIRIEDKAN